MREIIFDTETTGLDPNNGDRIVEIGCIEMVNRITTGAVFHAYFHPERDMPIEAERVHGLSSAFLADKPRFAARAEELIAFLGDSPLVAHNAQFDFGFLNAELLACGHEAVDLARMIDTLALARRRHPGAKHSLDALCSRYGVDRSHREKHGALLDAELLAQVYVELTGGRQIGLELAGAGSAIGSGAGGTDGGRASEGSAQIAPARFTVRHGELRPARPHSASAEESAAHKAFLASMGIADWTN